MHPYNTLNVPQIVKKGNNNKYLTFNTNFDIQRSVQMTWTSTIVDSIQKIITAWTIIIYQSFLSKDFFNQSDCFWQKNPTKWTCKTCFYRSKFRKIWILCLNWLLDPAKYMFRKVNKRCKSNWLRLDLSQNV